MHMKFGIVTISYNQAAFLERAMRSVLDQNHPDMEYIVMDGGSTDGSLEIIRTYSNRLHHWQSRPDDGAPAALNAGFQRTEADILGYLNSDDRYLPGTFMDVEEVFESDPRVDVIYGNGYVDDMLRGSYRPARSDPWNPRKYAYGACAVVQQATFFRREAYLRTKGFNVSNRTCWDGELLVDLAMTNASFRHVDRDWGVFTIHADSLAGSGRMNQSYPEDRRRLFKKLLGRTQSPIDTLYQTAYRTEKFLRRAASSVRHT